MLFAFYLHVAKNKRFFVLQLKCFPKVKEKEEKNFSFDMIRLRILCGNAHCILLQMTQRNFHSR